jgi:hypothetical protein
MPEMPKPEGENDKIPGMPMTVEYGDDDSDLVSDIAAEVEARYGPRTGQYNLRAWKQRQYSHLHTIVEGLNGSIISKQFITCKPHDFRHIHTELEHTAMTQHGLKKGLKEFGDAGVEAVLSELKQLHD